MEEILTVPQLAKQLRVNEYTIRRWIHRGLLDAEKIIEGKRHRYRIKQSALASLNSSMNKVTS
jgi:excisionase family DNA binding protein